MSRQSGISPGLVARLRGLAAEAETGGSLTAEQLAVCYEQGWFKLFVPVSYGGLGLTLPEAVRLEEELAFIDGSLGWTVTLCAGANLFVGYMDQAIARPIFSDPRVCFGGSGQATGVATAHGDRYRVSGTWHYATGAPHLTHFTANCMIGDTDEVRSFFFPKEDVRVDEDWNAFGLRATASHSFAVDAVWVNRAQSFLIAPEQATLDDPIYRYPFMQLAEATLAANTLGMTRHFMACVDSIGSGIAYEMNHVTVTNEESLSKKFYSLLENTWAELLADNEIDPELQVSLSSTCHKLVRTCRESVLALYPHIGMMAADRSTVLNRIWRDLFTASQHSLLRG